MKSSFLVENAFEPDASSTTVVVEVKRRLSSLRAFRDALARLAGYLAREPDKRGVLLLVDPKVTSQRITSEVDQFRQALRPKVAQRVTIVISRDGELDHSTSELTAADWKLLENLQTEVSADGEVLPRPDLQSEVLRLLVLQWLQGSGPVTLLHLQKTVGCNYRTVAAAIKRLGKSVTRHRNRKVELAHFPREAWARMVARSETVRATRRYSVRSGTPRSANSLVRRLLTLDRDDIAIGGALGARHYLPDLDLIGTPRLDITFHAPANRASLDFIRQLDPALRAAQDPGEPAHLVVQFLRRKVPFFENGSNGAVFADPVECLLDLHDARLESQALEFLNALVRTRSST